MGGKFLPNLNMTWRPIAEKYCEGKLKRIVKTKLKVPEIVSREQFGGCECGGARFTACCQIRGRRTWGKRLGMVERRFVLIQPGFKLHGLYQEKCGFQMGRWSFFWGSGWGTRNCALIMGFTQGLQPPRSACSYNMSHTLNIPSWNTDQGVHQSWEYFGGKTNNAQWK